MRVCLPLGLLDEDEMASDNMQIPQGLFCYRVHRDMILVGGALTDGGTYELFKLGICLGFHAHITLPYVILCIMLHRLLNL